MRIKEIREKKSIHQKDLAKSAGITPEYLSQLENGKKTNPTYTVLRSIARSLGCGLDALTEETLAMHDNT